MPGEAERQRSPNEPKQPEQQQPTAEDYLRAIYADQQEAKRTQAEQAAFNRQVAQTLGQLSQPQPRQTQPPAMGDIDAANKRVLDEFATNPLRVIKEVKDTAVLEARQAMQAEFDEKLNQREQMAALREFERQVMAANQDLIGYEANIANYISATDATLPYNERVRIALDNTRAWVAQRDADAVERVRRDAMGRARQSVPSGGQGTQAGQQPEPELSELDYKTKVFEIAKAAQQKAIAGKGAYSQSGLTHANRRTG